MECLQLEPPPPSTKAKFALAVHAHPRPVTEVPDNFSEVVLAKRHFSCLGFAPSSFDGLYVAEVKKSVGRYFVYLTLNHDLFHRQPIGKQLASSRADQRKHVRSEYRSAQLRERRWRRKYLHRLSWVPRGRSEHLECSHGSVRNVGIRSKQ